MAFLETMAKLIERYNSFFTEGIVNTLIIAAFSVLFGAILGTLMASLRMCRIPPLRWIAVAYIECLCGGDHPFRYSGCGRRTDGGRPERWLQQR